MSFYKRRADDRDDDRNLSNKYDDPPNSRLFIVCDKKITEDEFRDAFEPYGVIEEIWILKDRSSGESKGIVYIKFSKTSEAALAVEEMNGKCVANCPRPMKVMIAHSRDQGSRRENNEEERLFRLFVVIPKTFTKEDLKDEFSQYGDVDFCTIVTDRTTKESKGFGYVKFHRISHAAKAFEECDRSYKPVFADPKPSRNESYDMRGPGASGGSGGPGYDMSFMDTSLTNPDGNCRLVTFCSPTLNQDQLWRLFDLVPGLDYCELKRGPNRDRDRPSKATGIVVYNNPQSATYAKEKLNGFEYPPGFRVVVKFDEYGGGMGAPGGYGAMAAPRMPGFMSPPVGGAPGGYSGGARPGQSGGSRGSLPPELQTLADTISQATAAIQAAGFGISGQGAGGYDSHESFCSVKLPAPQPLAPADSTMEERLFIVCSPRPPPQYVLKDCFGRFGNLMDVYMLVGKTCGYAKYADKESAQKAVDTLHLQEVGGARLKVMIAEQQREVDRKRPKMDQE